MKMGKGKTVVSASFLRKTYQTRDIKVEVLKDVNLKIEKGEFTLICGASGSGKTTLLNIIGGIDKPTSGEIIVFGIIITLLILIPEPVITEYTVFEIAGWLVTTPTTEGRGLLWFLSQETLIQVSKC